MKYMTILIFLTLNSFAFANDCESLSFMAEYEYSSFDDDGNYIIHKEKRKLPKKWNDNDDLFLGIIIEGQFIDEIVPISVTYFKNGKEVSKSNLKKTIHTSFENYFVVDNTFFLKPNARPFEITLSVPISESICTHKILIGGDN